MTVEARHLNGLDLGHGGAIFTLADYAFAAASNSHGIDAVAISITISYFKAAKAGDVLTAEAKEIAVSRKIGTYAISVFNQNGDTVAFMQGTAFRKTA
jgi:acyl-CoA thioesterase